MDDTVHLAVDQTVERGVQPSFDAKKYAGSQDLRRGYFFNDKSGGSYSAAFIWKPSSILSAGTTG